MQEYCTVKSTTGLFLTLAMFNGVSQRSAGEVHRGVGERKGGRGRDAKKGEGGTNLYAS